MIALTITVDHDGLDRVLAAADTVLDEALIPAVIEAQLLIEREVRERTPTSGAGTLRDSIGALPVQISASAITAEVGTALAYAAPVEAGSKPHRPPIEPLAEWARRKLGKKREAAEAMAWAMAAKIEKHGSEGRFMFRDGLAAVAPQVQAILVDAIGTAVARLDAGGA